MIEIIPALLPKSVEELEAKLLELPDDVSFVHFDVLEEDIWAPLGRDFEAHLMVRDPGAIIPIWMERGAKRIIVHSLENLPEEVSSVELGLGVELHIPLEDIFPLLPQVEFLHLMSISEIGEQGHPFETKIFDRIKEVKSKFPDILVSVDGGVNISNWKELEAAGADRLTVGSAFKELWSSLKTK